MRKGNVIRFLKRVTAMGIITFPYIHGGQDRELLIQFVEGIHMRNFNCEGLNCFGRTGMMVPREMYIYQEKKPTL